MKYSAVSIVVAGFFIVAPLMAQNTEPANGKPETTLQVTSRAVLVDVTVIDRSGHPVKGLKQDAFTVTEQGKAQTVSFFEEHTGVAPLEAAELPKLPPNTFSNFSPFPAPDAVNVLLLDSLNTRMESQSFVHSQAVKFLKNSKPGSRMAIFTMGLGLHFIQGFTDDPALLMKALNDKKNNEVQTSVMIKGQDETNAQANLVGMMQAPTVGGGTSTSASPGMIEALKHFLAEQDFTQKYDRGLVTLTNLQRLATFLTAFPGRKNVIWFMESFPALTAMEDNPKLAGDYKKTMNMLAAARVAIYPVDARGVGTIGFYQADNQMPSSNSKPYQIIGVDSSPGASTTAVGVLSSPQTASTPGGQVSGLRQESEDRNGDQMMQQMFAEDSGGKAFANTNGLAQVIDNITSTSSDFYTLSYTPANAKMDGGFRKIEVNVAGGKYTLSYRRGYYAEDAGLPGEAIAQRNQQIKKLATQNPVAVDPLLPFMDLGMPQSTNIVYKTRIQILPAGTATAGSDAKNQLTYGVDFLINFNDIELVPESNGNHAGKLNLSLIAYDRYGNIANRKDHVVNIDIKPDVYAIFQKTGIQLHGEIGVPKGQFWLRTGVYDQATQKVGTLETPLSAVKDLAAASQ